MRTLCLLDTQEGRFVSYEQHQFSQYEDTPLGQGIDLVSTGRFDRFNLFASSSCRNWVLEQPQSHWACRTLYLKLLPSFSLILRKLAFSPV